MALPGFAMQSIETGDVYWPSRHWTNYLSTTSSLGLIKSLANCCSFSVSSHSTLLSSLFNSWQQSRDIRGRVSNNFNTVLCYLSTLQHTTQRSNATAANHYCLPASWFMACASLHHVLALACAEMGAQSSNSQTCKPCCPDQVLLQSSFPCTC